MSFEGYYQLVCTNGHQYNADLYGEEEHTKCPICNSCAKWWNLVNLTNGSFEGDGDNETRIDGYVELVVEKAAKTCKCDKCGNDHIIEQETYLVPTKEGHIV